MNSAGNDVSSWVILFIFKMQQIARSLAMKMIIITGKSYTLVNYIW